jgi:hypothetical protein
MTGNTTASMIYCICLISNYYIYWEGEQLENYTKYQLKAVEELSGTIAGMNNIFVIA